MSTVQLQTLDIVIVAADLLGITALGLWVSRGVRTTEDFFLAGRSLPWWIAGLSLVVSDIGAKDMIGLAGDAYRYGIVMMNFDFVGCTFAVLIAAFLFMPLFWDAGITTIPEYLGRRYNMTVRTFFAVVGRSSWSARWPPSSSAPRRCSRAARLVVLVLGRAHVGPGRDLHHLRRREGGGGDRRRVVRRADCRGGAPVRHRPVARRRAEGHDRARAALPWTGEHFELLPSASHPAYPWPAVVLGLGLVLGPPTGSEPGHRPADAGTKTEATRAPPTSSRP